MSKIKSEQEMLDIIREDLGHEARMISGSKSFYRSAHSDNFVIFNSNLIVKEYGKIWHGDIDITVDGPNLKKIAKKIGTTIYILYEMHCRFETEKDSIQKLMDRSAWNTRCKKFERREESNVH